MKKYTAILFDLDGTLLPMDQDKFVSCYFGLLAKFLAPFGYEADPLIKAIWKGTKGMVMGDGSKRNDEVFWETFRGVFGEKVDADREKFDQFYREQFKNAKESCGYNEKASMIVKKIKESGTRLVLATNPIFPALATMQRIEWAGLDPEDFEWITTYENSYHCKPNPGYFAEILERIGVPASECLMVGNDVSEDTVAAKLGMDIFLISDWLINKEEKDITDVPHGDFDALEQFIFGEEKTEFLKGFTFRDIRPEEADQAAYIEYACFPPNEACSEKMMKERVLAASEVFLVAVDNETGKIAGFLNGLATKEEKFHDGFFVDATLYDKEGTNVMLLGLDVLEVYRGKGLASEIVRIYAKREKEKGRKKLILTCLEDKVKMYQKMGFLDLGMADSTWGGEAWHEMVMEL